MTQAPSSGGPTLCPSCGNANYLSTGSCWKCGHRFEPEVAPPSITPETLARDISPSTAPPALAPTSTFTLAPPLPVVSEEPAPPKEPEEEPDFTSISEEPPEPRVEPDPQQELPPFAPPLPRSEPRNRRPYLAPSKPVPRRTGAVPAPPTVRVCPRCAAILHAGAYHCWKCGADTPLYTPEVRHREEWAAQQEQLWRERNAPLRAELEAKQSPYLPNPPQINITPGMIKLLARILAVTVLVALTNAFFGSWLSGAPVPFSIIGGFLLQLSTCAAFLIVPLLIVIGAAIVAQDTNRNRGL
jgi:hypothetical protein